MQDSYERIIARALERYFRELATTVVRRYLALETRGAPAGNVKQVSPGDLLTPDDEAALEALMQRYAGAIVEEQSALIGELIGVDPLADGMPGMQLIRAEVARRVVNVNAGTRRAIQDVLLEGLRNGYSARQIANGVPDDEFRGLRAVVSETYRGRHETIARTEVAHVANRTSEDRYRAGGVEEVDISDGPDCGWTFHDDPDKADGSRRTLAELHEYPLSHPNCRRVPLPVVEF